MFSSHLHYLTSRKLPAFITNEKPVSIGFVSLSYRTARKIRKRTLFYEPFPRVPPFYCERCGLASSRSRILVEHDCSKKFPYSDYANCKCGLSESTPNLADNVNVLLRFRTGSKSIS